MINNSPIELPQYIEKREYVPGGSFNDQQKYSYCGPSTRYEQRIREGYKNINELNQMCELHDQFYNKSKENKENNITDVALAHRADEIAIDSNFDVVQRKDTRFIPDMMKAKAHLGFGVNMNKKKIKKCVLEKSWYEELADEHGCFKKYARSVPLEDKMILRHSYLIQIGCKKCSKKVPLAIDGQSINQSNQSKSFIAKKHRKHNTA